MYCIVFNGRVLEGHVPTQVKAAVATRLRLGPAEIEQLFSGRRAILKKNVPESTAVQYLSVLRGLGMNAALAQMPGVVASASQAPVTFKIVFWGQVLEGFSLIGVMRAAASRLTLSTVQAERLFEGDKVVLQRGVSPERAARYVRELALIGMRVEFEAESAPEAKRNPPRPARARPADEEVFAGMLGTQFELPGGSVELAGDVDIRSDIPAVSVPAGPASAPVAGKIRSAGMPTSGGEYVRCSQCGHRQAWRNRCIVCGVVMERRESERRLPGQPLDASAYATPTTVLGNLPPGLVRSGSAVRVATSSRSPEETRGVQAAFPEDARTAFMSVRKPHLIALSVLMAVLIYQLW